jgi:hypothetical protein
MLVAAASAMLSHPRVCTAWALSRFPRSFLGGSVALALESLQTQLLFRNRASSEHVTAAAAEGSSGSGVGVRGRGEREGSAQEKDWTKKLQLMLPGSLGFSVRGERGKEDLIAQTPAGRGGAGGGITGGQRTSRAAIGWGGDSELSSTSEVDRGGGVGEGESHGGGEEEESETTRWRRQGGGVFKMEGAQDDDDVRGVWEGGVDLYEAISESQVELVSLSCFEIAGMVMLQTQCACSTAGMRGHA